MPSIFQIALICVALRFLATVLAGSTTHGEQNLIDLSYCHRLTGRNLAGAVRSNLHYTREIGESLCYDLSSSHFDDSALEHIILDIIDAGSPSVAKSVSIVARMIYLSEAGVVSLFSLLRRKQEERISAGSEAKENVTLSVGPRLKFLDLGWNSLGASKVMCKALQQLIASPQCPTTLRLDCCGLDAAACRALGKGLIKRYTEHRCDDLPPLSLHLSGNSIGDSGAAALAAALRSMGNRSVLYVMRTLDLSDCDISNKGVEALALSLDSSSWRLEVLDLSSNTKISDQGAMSLGKALLFRECKGITRLDLSNTQVGDRGVAALAKVFGLGKLPKLAMRSCQVTADGATHVGRAIRSFSCLKESETSELEIDLSGNALGVVRGKEKDKRYSASRFKVHASATAASYVRLLRKSLTEVGLEGISKASESDDEVERHGGEVDKDADASTRCGLKAMTNELLRLKKISYNGDSRHHRRVSLGLRQCFIDHTAADALAAALLHSRDKLRLNIRLDVRLNPLLEDEMIEALHENKLFDNCLVNMGDKYSESMSALGVQSRRSDAASNAVEGRFSAASGVSFSGETVRDIYDMPVAVPFGMEISDDESDSGNYN